VLTFGSLFTGGVREHGGGFDVGLIAAGFTPRWEVEITRGRSVVDYGARNLVAVDLICGGPPSTRTSALSRLQGARTNETLWPEMLRIVAELLPAWVLVEQPRSVDPAIVCRWAAELQRIGYGVSGRIVNSAHWLPQQRARWYLVGRLGAIGVELRDRLYAHGERMARAHVPGAARLRFDGDCADCLPGGIYSRVSARRAALVAAGNAVSVPVAQWLGEQIWRVHHDVR